MGEDMKYFLALILAFTVSQASFADIKIVFSDTEFADLQKRIDECEKSGDLACIFEIMRELAGGF